MNKPNWKDAPDWAMWLTMDKGYYWVWHELEPTLNIYGSYISNGKFCPAAPTVLKEKRPC